MEVFEMSDSNANAKPVSNAPTVGNGPNEQQLTLPLALEDGRVPGLFKNAIYAFAVFLAVAIAWMFFGQIRELAVASGNIVPVGDVKLVHHLEGGQVEAVLVAEGETVEKGAPLVRLRPVAARSDLQRAELRAASLELQLIRLNALIRGNTPDFGELGKRYRNQAENQMSLYEAEASLLKEEHRALEHQIESLRSSLAALLAQRESGSRRSAILNQRVAGLKALYERNISSQRQLLEARLVYEKEVSENSALTGNIASTRAKLARARADLQAKKRKDLQVHITVHSKLALELAEIRETIKKHSDRLLRHAVRSPVTGIVQKLTTRSAGEVVPPGGLVAEIVPSGTELVARVRLDPKDIGHVRTGDTANLKISTFDPNVYGTIKGTVHEISPTTVQPSNGKAYYSIVIALDRTYLGSLDKRHSIAPGMEVKADVITGSKSIMTYVFKPLHQSLNYAFTER